MSRRDYSVVEFFGNEDGGHRCGYCKSSFGSKTDGMWAHSLTVQDYQDLIDRGWRRSGCYCYKSKMDETCCPLYTIKCDILDFQMSKSQRKVIKKVNRFLEKGLPKKAQVKETNNDDCADPTEESIDFPDLSVKNQASIANIDRKEIENIKKIEVIEDSTTLQKSQPKPVETEPARAASSSIDRASINIPCKKAKLMRMERRLEKLKKRGLDPSLIIAKNQPQTKTLEQFLQLPVNPLHNLELRLVQSCPPSEEFQQTKAESFQVYKKYQIIIHDDKPETLTEKSFTRFLVNSPLEQAHGEGGVTFGSYHQQYWLDDKLIAVGVIDLLPNCVSSVYFYYDPDFSHLSLGTYAALREIAMARELQVKEPALKYYYMGFYIHSCPKMRYKGQYTPSKLLCPVTYTWHPIEKCRPLLDANKYCVFDHQGSQDNIDIHEVLVLHQRCAMPFWRYASRKPVKAQQESEEVKCYAKLVGHNCAHRMLLYRDDF